MKQEPFYMHLNNAKQFAGILRTEVMAARRSSCIAIKYTLKKEITKLISNLKEAIPLYQSIGKKCEVDVFTIYYQSLLAILNSS